MTPQTASPGRAGEARSERLELVRARRSSGAGLALSVAAVAFAAACVLTVAGDVEARVCSVPDDRSTCVVVGR